MIRKTSHYLTVTACLFIALTKVPGDDLTFFENRIRPVLVKHCYKCHSQEAAEVGGKLLLDSREGLLKGGEAGAAIVPGDAEKSLLLQALRYDGLEMPPEAPLPESVINDFARWIRGGAVDPRTSQPAKSNKDDESKEALWAFQPLHKPVSTREQEHFVATRRNRPIRSAKNRSGRPESSCRRRCTNADPKAVR